MIWYQVEEILEETLFEAKVRTIDLDNTVAEAMKQVLVMMMICDGDDRMSCAQMNVMSKNLLTLYSVVHNCAMPFASMQWSTLHEWCCRWSYCSDNVADVADDLDNVDDDAADDDDDDDN